MDREVSRTLAELERKLHELERVLTSIGNEQREGIEEGRRREQAADAYASSAEPATGARLIDEGLEAGAATPSMPAPRSFQAEPEGSPQAATVDSGAGEQRTRGCGESIELSELVRFRDLLDRTLRELVEDYERIICLRSASPQSRPPVGES